MNYSLPDFDNKHVVFVGKGLEWRSFEQFIPKHARVLSVRNVYITDETRESVNAELAGLDLTQTIIVKTAGYPGRLMPVPYTTPTRVFFECLRQLGARSVCITGTKGKTTTTSLIGDMMRAGKLPVVVCGNIGVPMLDALFNATSETIFVIEISSYQLSELERSPSVAVITNLFHDHVDYHGSRAAYWEAKHNLVRHMDENGVVIYSKDNEIVASWLENLSAKRMPVDPEESVDMSKAKLIGDHNRQNYLMARTVAELFGVSRETCEQVLTEFEPVRHRLQIVRKVRGVTYVDDAIGSTPEATIAGMQALIKNVGPIGCVLLGGVDRQYDYSELVALLHRVNVPTLVLFPNTGAQIRALLPADYQPEIFETRDMGSAVTWAAEHTPSGSICLLSTAAPSTVLWTTFEEKGSLFQQAVLELPNA